MPIHLPEHATEASKLRAELAERLVQSCPSDLADEIALVGSTARGYADDDSDLELNLWAEAIPPLEARIAWLKQVDVSQWVVEEAPRSDDSYWIHAVIDQINVELGWQTFAIADRFISTAVSSAAQPPVLIEIVASAIPLRTMGKLHDWQATLSAYSNPFQESTVNVAIEEWSRLKHFTAMRRLAQHGERLLLAYYLIDDLNRAVHLLYASYRRWSPKVKWTLTVAREFAPFDLDARIDAILGDPSLERRVDLCAQFCLEVLALVPKDYDVSKAVEALKQGLG